MVDEVTESDGLPEVVDFGNVQADVVV